MQTICLYLVLWTKELTTVNVKKSAVSEILIPSFCFSFVNLPFHQIGLCKHSISYLDKDNRHLIEAVILCLNYTMELEETIV